MDNKKAGILTFHGADNLGAVLQAYALSTVIRRECGIDAQIIDYECKKINATRYYQKGKGIKSLVKSVPMSAYYAVKRKGFEKFRKEMLCLSDVKYNKDNISESQNSYDIFITGSDQVWNPECSDNDFAYVLDFVADSSKKYSYAASIGNYNFSSNDSAWIDYIKEYSGISLRENSAKNALLQYGIDNSAVHPDPVFLLGKEEWQGIMTKRLEKKKYILVYLVLPNVNVMNAAKSYAEKHNCKIISNKKSIDFILRNSPSEFISWINYAECVFTNSFHGTAFSLIFNKPFYSDTEMITGGINHRVNDLLVASDCTEFSKKKDDYCPPDAHVGAYFDKIRNEAIDYLKGICSDL